jgi:hypothetical protein
MRRRAPTSSSRLFGSVGAKESGVASGVRRLAAVSLGVLLLASAAGAAAPTITQYSAGITADSSPAGIAAGPDGNLWFTEFDGDRIGKITPAGVVTEYRAGITAGSEPDGIVAGRDGNLWFTELDGEHIGKITTAGVVNEYGAAVTVTVTVKGKGRVTGGGISCPARCKATIAFRATLTLRASAARGNRFAGWSGGCTGLHACTIHPVGAVRVSATFRKRGT